MSFTANFVLTDNVLTKVSGTVPTTGSVNVYKCRFEINNLDVRSQLNRGTMTAVFWVNRDSPYYAELSFDTGNLYGECIVPDTVLVSGAPVKVALVLGAYGSGALSQFDSSVFTSTVAKFIPQQSAVPLTDIEQPTLSFYAALLNDISEVNLSLLEQIDRANGLSDTLLYKNKIYLTDWQWDSSGHQVTQTCGFIEVEQNTDYSILGDFTSTPYYCYITAYDENKQSLGTFNVSLVEIDDHYSVFNSGEAAYITVTYTSENPEYIVKGNTNPKNVLHEFLLGSKIEVGFENLSEYVKENLNNCQIESPAALTSCAYDIAALKSKGVLSVGSSESTVSYTFDIGSVTSSPLEFTPSIKCPALTPKESGGFVQDSLILLDRLRLNIPANDFKGNVKELAEQMGLTGDNLPCSVSFGCSTGHAFMTINLDLSGVRDIDSAKELLTEGIEHIELSWITPEVIT